MIKMYGKPIRVNKASSDKKSAEVGANLSFPTGLNILPHFQLNVSVLLIARCLTIVFPFHSDA